MQLKKLIISALIMGTMFPAFNASADSINIFVGDNDGYGLGIPNGASTALLTSVFPAQNDKRSISESSATNGAQATDYYVLGGSGLPSLFNVIFPLANDLSSGIFELDMADFQNLGSGSSVFASFSGSPSVNFLQGIDDGFGNSAVRSFTLDALTLANANIANQLIVSFNLRGSDYVAFDYFRLTGEELTGEDNSGPSAVPVPAAAWLFGSALLGFFGLRRKNTV